MFFSSFLINHILVFSVVLRILSLQYQFNSSNKTVYYTKYIVQMKRNQPSLQRISNVISISKDYAGHKHRLQHAHSCIDSQNSKQNAHHRSILSQRAKYRAAISQMQRQMLCKTNSQVVDRIINISIHQPSASLHNPRSESYRKTMKSMQSSLSRRRISRSKEIEKQNQSLTERILTSHGKDSYAPKPRQCTKQKALKEVRERYSGKNTSSLLRIVNQSLKIQLNDVPFLPQIQPKNIRFSFKRY